MANPTPVFSSPSNLFIPEATGQVVAYLRQPGKFKLLDYAQIVGSTKTDSKGWPVCLFTILDPDAPVRVVTDQEYAWEDGDDPPEGAGMLVNFTTQEVRMFRRAYPYRVGEQTAATATLIPILPIEREIALMLAMTNKTARVWTLLDNASNWSGNTADANVLNGNKGKWSQASATEGSPFYLGIKRTFATVLTTINLGTNSVVQPEDLRCVVSPLLAVAMAETGEITDYLKGGVYAKAMQEGKEYFTNGKWGLPSHYQGVEIVVEDACRVTDRPNSAGTTATTNRNYIKDPTKACFISRIGGLDGVEGAPSFSTLQIYYYKYEMTVEERFDQWAKRHDGRVIDQYKEVLAAVRSGYLVTACM
jgi:hypothetical protein